MEKPFCATVPEGTRLIETFGWWPGEGARRWPLHRSRLCRTARRLGFPFPDAVIDAQVVELSGSTALRCRLTLNVAGDVSLTTTVHEPDSGQWRLTLSPNRLTAEDPWLTVKTTQRALYDRTRLELTDTRHEVIFLNNRGEVCEGTMTNIFLVDAQGIRRTPALKCGALPGVLRQSLIADGYRPSLLSPDDLKEAQSLMIGNSLRGLIQAKLET